MGTSTSDIAAQRRPIAKRRVVGFVVACVFGGLAIFFRSEGLESHRRVLAMESAELARLSVDLSRTGIYKSPLAPASGIAHSQMLLLQLADQPADGRPLLAGLVGKMSLVNAQGDVVASRPLFEQERADPTEKGIMLTSFHQPADESFSLRIEVDQAAIALAGREQQLVAVNWLCGLEFLVCRVLYALAAIAGLIALLVGVLVLPDIIRFGWRRRPTLPTANQV